MPTLTSDYIMVQQSWPLFDRRITRLVGKWSPFSSLTSFLLPSWQEGSQPLCQCCQTKEEGVLYSVHNDVDLDGFQLQCMSPTTPYVTKGQGEEVFFLFFLHGSLTTRTLVEVPVASHQNSKTTVLCCQVCAQNNVSLLQLKETTHFKGAAKTKYNFV